MRASTRRLVHGIVFLAPLACASTAAAQGVPIGFEEEFALSEDRAATLERLIPGTEEYYYYNCLHRQNTGALDQVPDLLGLWIERHGRTAGVEEIENRQALLNFARDPAATYEFLIRRLGLRFDHQRQVSGEKPDLPTRLDPALLSPAVLTARAQAKHPGSLDGFNASAFEFLAGSELDDALLMSLLRRLERPDLPNLPALVARNLADKKSEGFGSLDIHKKLLLEQLEECLRLRPSLLREGAFVETYLRRLLPSADVQWQRSPEERAAYLARLETFVARLAPAFNSLKAHVLYHRLVLDLGQGQLDKQRFLAYLRLPRQAGYVNPDFLKRTSRSDDLVDCGRGFPTDLLPIGDDEPLVRACLSHFFQNEDSYEPYAEYVREDYLAPLFAETKILAGSGDMERWYSLLGDPARYEALRDRVEIEFPPTQKTAFVAGEPVSLEVDLKNVGTLLVKVFEISALNYHLEEGKEVDASINLDGLVANEEQSHAIEENPLRRVRRTFDFPGLDQPGVYVVEFIGNGLSSRAVIRKGRLQYLERQSAAGQALRVLDEAGNHLRDASIRFGGHEYLPDEDGEILLPYSTDPGTRQIILCHGRLATLEPFEHLGEEYRLDAAVFVERESLLPRRGARIVVRPALLLNGEAVSLDLLEEPILTITASDSDGVSTTTEVRDLKLSRASEFVHEIQVPERLATLSVSLRGKVKNLSRGETVDLDSGPSAVPLNGIDRTDQIGCPLLGLTAEGYVLDVLGKNGEPIADHAVELRFSHRDYADPVTVTLKTDARGRIVLGRLEGITAVHASGLPEGSSGWPLRNAARSYPSCVQGEAGQTLRVPYQGAAQALSRSVASLLEVRGGAYAHDAFDHLFLQDGFLELRDLAPGDYSLLLKEADRTIAVKVTAGRTEGGWALGRDRRLETGGSDLLHIAETRVDGESLLVRLANASAEARVHVFATRFLPAFDPFFSLVSPARPLPAEAWVEHADSSYHSGREIGDEYRYILERRYAKKFPGNMLRRPGPGLLLNPWALEETEGAIGEGGGATGGFGGAPGARRRGRADGAGRAGAAPAAAGVFPNLDFLPQPSAVLVNLKAGADGVVRVPLADLGLGQQVHVIAVDKESTVCTSLTLPEKSLEPADQRLAVALDPARHLVEQRSIDFVDKGASAVIEDVATASVENYDSLAKVHRLFLTLSGNQDLARFAFVLRWPELSPEEKRELYSQHACHELHFFIQQKDPEFFAAVIRPYLANKARKTFLDRWLLGEDLSAYLEPWAFSRLNVVERILLSQRLEGEAEAVARHVRDLLDLVPPNPELEFFRFASALRSRSLEQEPGLGKELADIRELLKKADEPAAAPSGPGAPGGFVRRKAKDEEAEVAEDSLEMDEVAADKAPARPEAEKSLEAKDAKLRSEVRRLYRAPLKTRRYVEHNYWHLPIAQQDGGLISANAFWRDYAEAKGQRPFLSTRFPEAAGSFAEMMLALAVLDLPFTAGEHAITADGSRLSLAAATPLLLVRKEIEEAQPAEEKVPLLLSQNFFRLDDRYRFEGSERRDNFVTDEFLAGVAYGCQVVLTNPTSSPRKLELLLQIPQGAIPVQNGFVTRGLPAQIEPYGTATFEYSFYFPTAGQFPHYPAHASREGELVAFAAPASMNVVLALSRVDTTSWEHVSQSGASEQVLAYLQAENLERTDLARIAWRMRERSFFEAVMALLRGRHVYHDTLWSYGLKHAEASATREFLRHADHFVARCGRCLESPLLAIDPIERLAYQHVEYEPLYNPRAHRFGKRREILNPDLARQYLALLDILAYRPRLDDADWMSVTYYLLLQDRVEEAERSFAKVNAAGLPTALQYDYLRAYLDFFSDGHALARGIAERYAKHPVERWRALFQDVLNQLDEAAGKSAATSDVEDRTQVQGELAAREPSLELKVEAQNVALSHRNVASCEISYYEMDIEFLFSTSPFVQQGLGSFAFIRPNRTDRVALAEGQSETSFALPEDFRSKNVLVEARAGGITRRQAYFANSLVVQMIEGYGQLKVTRAGSGAPLSKVYVKVFARTDGGAVRFHKDGYTDLRGLFDYASLSGEGAGDAERYAILILSEEDGAVIREAAPPAE
ncbi:MAG: hypothetical protein HY812_06095 [Planctomycetes bacterium]|nr:hypothetical protein [Planctomycetota bacterium]